MRFWVPFSESAGLRNDATWTKSQFQNPAFPRYELTVASAQKTKNTEFRKVGILEHCVCVPECATEPSSRLTAVLMEKSSSEPSHFWQTAVLQKYSNYQKVPIATDAVCAVWLLGRIGTESVFSWFEGWSWQQCRGRAVLPRRRKQMIQGTEICGRRGPGISTQ